MKKFAFIFILSITMFFSQGMVIKSLAAPEPPIIDGNYYFQNVGDGLRVAALDNGEGWQRVGPVTMNKPNPEALDQKWDVRVRPFYEGETVRLYEFSNYGPNGFNVMEIELPRPGVFPVGAKWELEKVDEREYLLRSHLWFDWDERGEDFCLQSNGVDENASIVECDRNNNNQLWQFLYTTD